MAQIRWTALQSKILMANGQPPAPVLIGELVEGETVLWRGTPETLPDMMAALIAAVRAVTVECEKPDGNFMTTCDCDRCAGIMGVIAQADGMLNASLAVRQ